MSRRRMMMAGKSDDIIIDARGGDTNAIALMSVIHARGWSEHSDYMTKKEAGNVTNISEYFRGNTSITDFSALQYFNLSVIPIRAFYQCSNLTKIVLPQSVISIDNYAFYGCTRLYIEELSDNVLSVGDSVFTNNTVISWTKLPTKLTKIGSATFQGCSSLAVTELPNNIKEIGQYGFYGCASMKLTKLPDELTLTGQRAFQNCTGLAITELPMNLLSIGGFTFYGCTNVRNLKLPMATVPSIAAATVFPSTTRFSCPTDMYDKYKVANVWSTMISRFTTY